MSKDIIFIRSNYELISINLNDVEYIESCENYVKIHFTNGKFVMSLTPLKTFLEKLPIEKFVRIHRKYIISIDKIKSIGNKMVRLNKIELPVSNSRFKSLKKVSSEQKQI